jgi:hypothetical protein
VRHDLGHAASTFTALIAAAAAVRWTPTPLGRLAGAGVCAVALAGTLVVLGRGATDSTWTLLDPWPRLQAAGDQARLVVEPGRRARERREAAATLRATYALPPAVIDRLRGHTVHVDPYETAVVWAYGLDWRPVPVFQDYAVYTNALDRENAAALLGPDAPERILRHGGPRIDGHTPESEGPEGLEAMICGYRQAVWAGGWQVLERAPDRCGPERSLGTVSAHAGDAVPIPPAPSPRDMVVARIHMPVPLLARLRTALYKPRLMPSVALDDRYGFLIPASLAAGPLLMRVPASVGWHDYAPGYSFDRLRVAGSASPVTIDFRAVRVEPARPAAASGTSPSRHVSATRKLGRARTSS